MEKLKILHKLQRSQQLILRGGSGKAYDIINEVVVEILSELLEERNMPSYIKYDPYDNDEYSRSHDEE